MSSFGFSGTIAHALMQRAEDGSSGAELGLVQPLPQVAFRRRAFMWIELDRSSTPRQLTSVYVSCWVVPSDAGARWPWAGARSRVATVRRHWCGAATLAAATLALSDLMDRDLLCACRHAMASSDILRFPERGTYEGFSRSYHMCLDDRLMICDGP